MPLTGYMVVLRILRRLKATGHKDKVSAQVLRVAIEKEAGFSEDVYNKYLGALDRFGFIGWDGYGQYTLSYPSEISGRTEVVRDGKHKSNRKGARKKGQARQGRHV